MRRQPGSKRNSLSHAEAALIYATIKSDSIDEQEGGHWQRREEAVSLGDKCDASGVPRGRRSDKEKQLDKEKEKAVKPDLKTPGFFPSSGSRLQPPKLADFDGNRRGLFSNAGCTASDLIDGDADISLHRKRNVRAGAVSTEQLREMEEKVRLLCNAPTASPS